jgi:MTH538 TIR-like domain (DUF1863)
MVKRVFTSFHYIPDFWRANQIRNIGKLEGNSVVTTNQWEEVTNGGDTSIQKWIDENIYGKSCIVVLVGEKTARRKWINYEIEKAWNDGKGVFGINIHKLKDRNENQANKGDNPFEDFIVRGKKLSSILKCYDSPFLISTNVYNHINANLGDWIEKAINIRNEN